MHVLVVLAVFILGFIGLFTFQYQSPQHRNMGHGSPAPTPTGSTNGTGNPSKEAAIMPSKPEDQFPTLTSGTEKEASPSNDAANTPSPKPEAQSVASPKLQDDTRTTTIPAGTTKEEASPSKEAAHTPPPLPHPQSAASLKPKDDTPTITVPPNNTKRKRHISPKPRIPPRISRLTVSSLTYKPIPADIFEHPPYLHTLPVFLIKRIVNSLPKSASPSPPPSCYFKRGTSKSSAMGSRDTETNRRASLPLPAYEPRMKSTVSTTRAERITAGRTRGLAILVRQFPKLEKEGRRSGNGTGGEQGNVANERDIREEGSGMLLDRKSFETMRLRLRRKLKGIGEAVFGLDKEKWASISTEHDHDSDVGRVSSVESERFNGVEIIEHRRRKASRLLNGKKKKCSTNP